MFILDLHKSILTDSKAQFFVIELCLKFINFTCTMSVLRPKASRNFRDNLVEPPLIPFPPNLSNSNSAPEMALPG